MQYFARSIVSVIGLLAAVLSNNSSAQAAYINGNFSAVGGGYTSGTAQATFTGSGGISGTFYTGYYKFTRDGSAQGSNAYADLGSVFKTASGNNLWTFCIELNQGISNPVGYNVANLTSAPAPGVGVGQMTANQAAAVRQLWARYNSTIGTNSTKAAAFQLALWEIIYDSEGQWGAGGANLMGSSYNFLGNGSLKSSTAAAANQANAWLQSLTSSGPQANLAALTSADDQDQLIELKDGYTIRGGDIVPTPAPAGLILAATGIVPLLALRRRLVGRIST
jgi:hypothetical protein